MAGKIERVAIIGAGIMGSGIAAAVFKYGHEVRLFDTRREVLYESCEHLKSRARRSQDPEKIVMAPSLEAALEGVDLIVEAIVEDLEVKKSLFRELGAKAAPDVIFASNTSSLPISEMAESSGRPEAFLGLHFFNPPVLMRLIEVTVGKSVNKDNLERVMDFIGAIHKTGVICRESPGFVVNRILLPVICETFRLLEERSKDAGTGLVETANDIDSAVLNAGLFPMGPLELADLTGLDTIYQVSEVLYHGFNEAPRYTPLSFMKAFVARGELGRKSGRGVYFYGNRENDPDLNPALDEGGNRILRMEHPNFDAGEIAAVVANEAYLVLEEGIVQSFRDIETCMELGTRWPKGPFGMIKERGKETLLDILRKKYARSGNSPRYRPSVLWQEPTEELEEFFKK